MSTAPSVPSHGWTDEDFDELPADGYRRELIDGVLYVSPPPPGRHQVTAMLLGTALDASAPAELVVLEGVEVKLSDSVRYTPDIVAVDADAYGDGRRGRFDAREVTLAVEIVSDSSRSLDRILKPNQYAAAGIPFYWRVEFEPQLEVHTFERGLGQVYAQTGLHRGELQVDNPWPVKIDLSRLVR